MSGFSMTGSDLNFDVRAARAFQCAVDFFTAKKLVPGINFVYAEGWIGHPVIGTKALNLSDLQIRKSANGRAWLTEGSKGLLENAIPCARVQNYIAGIVEAGRSVNSPAPLKSLAVFKLNKGGHVAIYDQQTTVDGKSCIKKHTVYFDEQGIGMEEGYAGRFLKNFQRTHGL